MTSMPKFNKFLLLGLTALSLGGYAIANADSVQNSIDSQIYNASGVTVFHSMEDIRYTNIKNKISLLENIYKDDVVFNNNFVSFKEAAYSATYKQTLADPFFYEDDLATLKDIEKELQVSQKQAKEFGDSVKPQALVFEEQPKEVIILKLDGSIEKKIIEPLNKTTTLKRISDIKDREAVNIANESTLVSTFKKK